METEPFSKTMFLLLHVNLALNGLKKECSAVAKRTLICIEKVLAILCRKIYANTKHFSSVKELKVAIVKE